ncbi:MAG TPA: hypothetical protein VNU26_11280, partial [Mycobacteriales bacterium]|nr:hypothetical protein [Mycobacteriales bacterium]
ALADEGLDLLRAGGVEEPLELVGDRLDAQRPLDPLHGQHEAEQGERPLRVESVTDELEGFLDSARPEEVETFVSEGFAPALERYWRRRRLSRLLPTRSR